MLIVKAGLQTTVQDLGRWGHQASGVPVAGAMDAAAHRTANALVDNPRTAATLEITLTGPEIECDRDATVAVTGAVFDLAVDGAPAKMHAAIGLKAGQRLVFGARRLGARAYLAIDGGFAVPGILGSRSTHLPSAMGGFERRALRAGDRLPVGNPVATAESRVSLARPAHPRRAQAARECVLRVLPAPDLERFEHDAFDALLSAPYVVRTESNRMGYRLRGPKLGLLGGGDGPLSVPGGKISDVTPIGLIQVPPSGDPVLLMADRPTTGGYAGIANVITADIDRAAQLAPGDACRFAPCSVDDALDAVFERERDLESVERRA